eukprot:CAMPEP_0118864344 /NCGR_PEP_ID=MMETSP1163-20130328/8954_1 /TAXON_ID=124430 /ORGANISM="Phaeomonas parva, Strain CCMP2877" /LENGTH=48 /DNA_ID= /DNA_START= /DNA_END= /DNA_ORIENTATION=
MGNEPSAPAESPLQPSRQRMLRMSDAVRQRLSRGVSYNMKIVLVGARR